MTRTNLITIVSVYVLLFISCSPGKEKTTANLKQTINVELTASAKYNAFAVQAEKDSLYNVGAMFRAVAKAESIHADNHLKVLEALGVKGFNPEITTFAVGNTFENLRNSIESETYEFTAMYPQVISEAKAENVENAVVSFGYAQDAEIIHSKIFAEALSKLSNDSGVSANYFVCSKCGFIYVDVPGAFCELCKTPSGKFRMFHADSH